MTRFRDTHICAQSRHFVFTATNQSERTDPCPGFSPDSLVQRNKNACPPHGSKRVAHLPQKPKNMRFIYNIITIQHGECQSPCYTKFV